MDLFLLTNLKTISLNTNSLEGTLGEGFAKFQNMERLLLDANFGPIPEEIGSLNNLTILDLGANEFTGRIPNTLYDLSSLEVLVLSTNNLDGPLSSDIRKMRTLKELNLQSNQFSGEIPTELGLLTDLTSLILGFNLFTGTIPSELALLTNLLFLDLSKSYADTLLLGHWKLRTSADTAQHITNYTIIQIPIS